MTYPVGDDMPSRMTCSLEDDMSGRITCPIWWYACLNYAVVKFHLIDNIYLKSSYFNY